MFRGELIGVTACLLLGATASAAQPVGPDLIVSQMNDVIRWGSLSGRTSWGFGTAACNAGDTPAVWVRMTDQHPVISTGVYKVQGGRIRQIGVGWAKHGFATLNMPSDCGVCPGEMDSTRLWPGCVDPYSAVQNGIQSGLGPRSQINPYTGVFTFPVDYTGYPPAADTLARRVVVENAEIDPSLNAGAVYVAEGQYVSPDEAAAGHGWNSVSYRPFTVSAGPNFTPVYSGGEPVRRASPAIMLWHEADAGVRVERVNIPGEGVLYVASRAVEVGDGRWRYDYAVQNVTSDRAVGWLEIPTGCASADGVEQSIPRHHSGEAWKHAPWGVDKDVVRLRLATTPFPADPDAAAVRWGTLASWRFESDRPPTEGEVAVGLFKPGTPASVAAPAVVPHPGPDMTGDGFIDMFDFDAYILAFEEGLPIADYNGDGFLDLFDLDAFVAAFEAGC
ncbi:MAG: hypothetical protein HRU70_04840 [Phycisphaeraceae bacterium]|nr:MAG: hypothetical protein HRU70_04840 [Phycisphaeraceae bacterium]